MAVQLCWHFPALWFIYRPKRSKVLSLLSVHRSGGVARGQWLLTTSAHSNNACCRTHKRRRRRRRRLWNFTSNAAIEPNYFHCPRFTTRTGQREPCEPDPNFESVEVDGSGNFSVENAVCGCSKVKDAGPTKFRLHSQDLQNAERRVIRQNFWSSFSLSKFSYSFLTNLQDQFYVVSSCDFSKRVTVVLAALIKINFVFNNSQQCFITVMQ